MASAHAHSPAPQSKNFIEIEGVRVSTDPANWTPLKISEIARLLLKPANILQYELKRCELAPNYHLAAQKTLFVSHVKGFLWWRFWVDDLQVFDQTKTASYVLATPSNDCKTYTR